jgi:hypothetical protein
VEGPAEMMTEVKDQNQLLDVPAAARRPAPPRK